MQYTYFGHHKCASTWILQILYSICGNLGWTLEIYKHNQPQNLNGIKFIVDVGARPGSLEAFEGADIRGFHVIRDPRDIVVSAYYSHKYSHPLDDWLVDHRAVLHQVSVEEGIRKTIDFTNRQFTQMGAWNYRLQNIYETRFEEITLEPEKVFIDILEFLGLCPEQITHKTLRKILHYHRFERLTKGRAKGEEDPQAHYRKGIIGDWENHLVGDNLDYFRQKYGTLLIDLGYERNLDW